MTGYRTGGFAGQKPTKKYKCKQPAVASGECHRELLGKCLITKLVLVSMEVPSSVPMSMVCALLPNRHDAPVRHIALHVFELDRGVVDMKPFQ